MTPKSYLIFDLDGTISEPAEGIAGSINYALEQSGHAPIDAAHISQYIGPPLDKVFRAIVGNAVDSNNLLNDLVQNYRIHSERPHSTLDYLSPLEFEEYGTMKLAA